MIFFEWDERKAAANLRKHGIRFEEAAQVFFDEFAMAAQDRVVEGSPAGKRSAWWKESSFS